MTTSQPIIDMYGEMQFLLKGLYEVTVANQAMLSALKESFPDVDYEKHHRAAMETASAKGVLDNIRAIDELIERMKRELKGTGETVG